MTDDNIHCLIISISPTHIISAISAIYAKHTTDNINVIIIVQWPIDNDQLSAEVFEVSQAMVKNFPFCKQIKIIPYKEMRDIINTFNISKVELWFKNQIGADRIDEIYYPHDVVGELFFSVASIYYNANRICFGDGLGLFVQRNSYMQLFNQPKSLVYRLRCIRTVVKKSISSYFGQYSTLLNYQTTRDPKTFHEYVSETNFHPDEAVLILPTDGTGGELCNIKYMICPKNIVKYVIAQCSLSAQSLSIYIDELLVQFDDKNMYILLTENYVEAGFISYDNEIQIYCNLIEANCSPGSVIFIKSHPGETIDRASRIKHLMEDKFTIVVINKQMRRYPIEIWVKLLESTNVMALSYSTLTLYYLYGKSVVNPMNSGYIEKYFYSEYWQVMKNSILNISQPLKNLQNWDGNTILFTSKITKI